MTTSALRVAATAAVILSLSACDSATPPEPVMNHVPLARAATNLVEQGREDGWEGGAVVFNSGEGKPDAFCFFQGNAFFTNQVTLVRSPSGNWTLSCRFENLAPIAEQETLTDWRCSIIGDPAAQTHQSSWVRVPSGSAHLECHFSDKPIEDAAVQFGGVAAAAQQAAFSLSLRELPGQAISGESVNVGLGCAIAADLTGKIAVAERGVCTFTAKVQNALNAGATGIIVYNSAAFGDQIIVMGGTVPVNLPAVFVGRSTGLALLAASPAAVTVTFCNRSASCRGEL